MLYKHLNKIFIYRCMLLSLVICLFSLLLSLLLVNSAFAQFPYSIFYQNYLPLYFNSYNNINNINPYYRINPYAGLFDQFLLTQNIASINRNLYYPQASVAGALIPFNSSLTLPFNFLGSFLPGAAPLNPLGYLYNAAAGAYFAATVPVDVSGSWTGTWVSTFLAGGITTGNLSITLAQLDTDVTGTIVFLLNKILKFGAEVVGTVTGNSLILTSTVIPGAGGAKSFDVTLTANVNGITMEGAYEIINNVTGNIAEEGTFTATRL